MPRRNLIIVGVLILILIIILFFAFSGGQEPAQVDQQSSLADISGPSETVEPASVAPADNVDQKSRADLERISSLFAERYGSFSNQNDFENITELEFFMSPDLKSWMNSKLNEWLAARNPQDAYYGINTKVLNQKITEYKPETGTAEVLLTTQRQEFQASGDTNVYEQQMLLKYVLIDNVWKVDGVYWQ